MSALTQMTLGTVPPGWLATEEDLTGGQVPTKPIYKMGRDASGQVTGHAWPDGASAVFVVPAEQHAVTVFAMPDPADAPTAPSVIEQAAAIVTQAFPSATQVTAQISATPTVTRDPAPAQVVPETGQAAALSPLVRAAVALFDANTMPSVAGAAELAEAFKTAAFAVSRGPRGPRTIAALDLLLQARAMAALALFEPNA